MALIKCNECEKEYSSLSESCPKCGHPNLDFKKEEVSFGLPKKIKRDKMNFVFPKKLMMFIVLLAIILVVIFSIFSLLPSSSKWDGKYIDKFETGYNIYTIDFKNKELSLIYYNTDGSIKRNKEIYEIVPIDSNRFEIDDNYDINTVLDYIDENTIRITMYSYQDSSQTSTFSFDVVLKRIIE